MRQFLVLFLFTFYTLTSTAQAPRTLSSGQIYEGLEKLNVLGSVLYIAAHPDDENTRLLAYLANEKLYRTGYLSITRGDGGQNLIGDEQGPPLGLIRTQELLAARRIDGAEQFFTRAYDFGYSKSPEETFRIWDKEKILSDVVWVIRKFKPDVIITRFPTTGEGGHGHHTASAILAGEAFEAAADPERFKEQFQYGVQPWKVKRLLWNTFNFGGNNTQRPDQFKIDVGGYNVFSGKSYGEISAESRSQHKSQGFGVASSRGTSYEYFVTIKGEPPTKTLFDNVTTDWASKGHPALKKAVDDLLKEYSFEKPQRSVAGLVNIYQYMKKNAGDYWQKKKMEEVQELIKACAGLYLEVRSFDKYAIPGDSIKMSFQANRRLGGVISIESIKIKNKFFVLRESLPLNENVVQDLTIPMPEWAEISQPYWLEKKMETGYYSVTDQRLIGKPWNDPEAAEVTVKVNGENMLFQIPILYKSTDPVKGEFYQPLLIIPRLEIKPVPELALAINNTPIKIELDQTKNSIMRTPDTLQSSLPGNIVANFRENAFWYSFKDFSNNMKSEISWKAVNGNTISDSYKTLIQYEHIPPIIYFSKAEADLVGIDLAISGKKIGYIQGAGDKVAESLQKMGYEVVILSEKNILTEDLSHLDAIVTGVRAYNVYEWLNNAHEILMKYVNGGGVLLVQYNTNNNIGPVKAKIGPYPFNISRTRVTDENAKINITDLDNPFLSFPNKISNADFDNWIQERSIYHAADYAANYKTVFSMNDQGEGPQEGSLIYTGYGKGRFIYTGLVFFRELPAGVPGAYRLFANLIAKPQ